MHPKLVANAVLNCFEFFRTDIVDIQYSNPKNKFIANAEYFKINSVAN